MSTTPCRYSHWDDPDNVVIPGTLTVGGTPISGGGGFSDLIQISDDGSVNVITEATPTTPAWDPAAAGGGYYRLEGTALEWAGAGHPTRINILTDGFYDINGGFVIGGGSAANAVVTAGLMVNGTPVAVLPAHVYCPQNVSGVSVRPMFPRQELAQGDYIEIYVLADGDDVINQTCVLYVGRVA